MIKTIKIFGDKHKVRRTFDIIDYIGGITGNEVYDENGEFILQYDCEKLPDLIKYLKWRFYNGIFLNILMLSTTRLKKLIK